MEQDLVIPVFASIQVDYIRLDVRVDWRSVSGCMWTHMYGGLLTPLLPERICVRQIRGRRFSYSIGLGLTPPPSHPLPIPPIIEQ